MFACCCASPYCAVNGCSRVRAIRQKYGSVEPTIAMPRIVPEPVTGWRCPACDAIYAPSVSRCFCTSASKTPNQAAE